MLRSWVGCAVVFTAVTPLYAAAQMRTEVMLNSDAVGPDAFEVLEGAFARDGITFLRATAAPKCSGTLAADDVSARVWISWSRRAAAQGETKRLMELCFQDRCRSAPRLLEPLDKLDARAREALITVVESGLTALKASCPENGQAARIDSSSPSVVPIAPTAAQARPDAASSGAGSRARSSPSEISDARHSEVRAAGPATAESAEIRGADDASPQREARSPSPPSAAAVSDAAPQPAGRPALAFGASYGVARWTGPVFAQRLSGLVGYAVDPSRTVYVGLEVSYTPQFRVPYEDLAFRAMALRVALELMASWPLYSRLFLVAHIGPAIEWVSVEPDVRTASRLIDPHSTSHGDPWMFARVGPAVRLYSGVLIGFEAQVDASWMTRDYGFTTAEDAKRVFSPDRVRLSVALNLRAEL